MDNLYAEEFSKMQKITPSKWFNDQTEEVVNLCTSIVTNSKIGAIPRFGDKVPG
jgi:predicted 3-demethylubiquinone-9 3-methyltransferase (glyoxalase superfamily)